MGAPNRSPSDSPNTTNLASPINGSPTDMPAPYPQRVRFLLQEEFSMKVVNKRFLAQEKSEVLQ